MTTSIWYWVAFNAFILVLLALDLGVFHRRPHAIGMREALTWSFAWIALSLLFAVGVYVFAGRGAALAFLTGYLIEKSLSVDNLFVFAVLFGYFAVPPRYQHKILFWGILGALVMRGVMIGLGAALIHRFSWVLYVFGAFLVLTGIRMLFTPETQMRPEANPVVRFFRRLFPVEPGYAGERFFIRHEGRTLATRLFIVLLVIEVSDLIFAVDSIPAIFGVTTDPFIVYTSNVFAILGLRSLYFALANIIELFHFLKFGLAVVLVFIGVKMLTAGVWHIPIALALGIVAGVLLLSIVASRLWPPEPPRRENGSAVTPSEVP